MTVKHKVLVSLGVFLLAVVIFIVAELIYIQRNGSTVEAPTIPRTAQTFGSGPPLKYVVMGDSTSIGQGADYQQSYSYQSAQHLAKSHEVTLLNVGISGATAASVLKEQLSKAVAQKPDIVLLAVGANDVTHFTTNKHFETSVQAIIDGLRRGHCDLKIVVTGSPAMGAVDRFPVGAKQLAAFRVNQLNTVYKRLVTANQLIFAPVAASTGPAFAADPTLFARDKFHPNARGYALWTPVINQALDASLQSTPEQCP